MGDIRGISGKGEFNSAKKGAQFGLTKGKEGVAETESNLKQGVRRQRSIDHDVVELSPQAIALLKQMREKREQGDLD